ncbi:MAG: hypothetical protein OEO20_05230 [Gemmatimonadota bacterium]|nr:hypothetical protein [Gemmatimonadota bacterium]MDH3368414.1 hypothetical protein [Gemmatimonadota bacterium]MDH3477686.1 hypothetical protein [Gemmatimonadota bacterium]MDH3570124.1 hypothetical protein [Gemmatimonadota bacterium]MDH5548798.1 hypothetical protein [Gemmatimonadota bacterium]
MKLLLIFVDSDHARDVERLLDTHGVHGYSTFPNVLGKGQTGRKLGTRAFPGSSSLYFVALLDGDCRGLCDELRTLRDEKGPEEGLKAYTLDTMEVL